MIVYFNRAGKPISSDEWSRLHRDMSYRRIGRDEIPDDGSGQAAEVSTVWLGMDHGFGAGHAPIIFETLVFGGRLANEGERYTTEAEAIAGHAKWVAAVRGDSLTSASL